MKRFIAAVLFAMLAAAQVQAGEKPPVDIRLYAQIDIGADGALRALTWEDKGLPLAKTLAARIEPMVRQWEFAPGMVNGVAADTRSYLQVRLSAQVHDDNSVALHVVSASTGLKPARLVTPPYPTDAALQNVDAVVVALIDFDAKGAPSVRSLEISGGKRLAKQFDEAVRRAVALTQVELEQVDGVPVVGSMRVPYVFCMSKKCFEQRKALDTMTAGNGESPQPLGSVAKLLTRVEGLDVEG